MSILDLILLVGAVLVVLAVLIGFCCYCLQFTGTGDLLHAYKRERPAIQCNTSIQQFYPAAAPKPYHDVEAALSDTPTDLPPPPRRGRLLEAAKTKHIAPDCRSDEDAQRKSLERDADYPQEIGEINTVFKVGRVQIST